MQLDLFFGPRRPPPGAGEWLQVGDRRVPVEFVRHPRARRYVLRLRPDGTARVSVPRRGSLAEARAFVQRQVGWLARQLARQEARPASDHRWVEGTEILFRGEKVALRVEAVTTLSQVGFPKQMVDADGAADEAVRAPTIHVRFADQVVEAPPGTTDFRKLIEGHLWRLGQATLPPRVFELAAQQQLAVQRVTVRDQRSRWGSCSRQGTVSLNWRLVQMPDHVSDYVIWHELMHLREMNHSPRFWREVVRVCPEFETARKWLRRHRDALR